MEVILDSGADVLLMPENWLRLGPGYGISATQEATVQMCDAQGQSMPYHGSRLLTLDLGEACVQEKFHVSSVSAPLLSLGRLLKKGMTVDERE